MFDHTNIIMKIVKFCLYLFIFFCGLFVGIICQKNLWRLVDPSIRIGSWQLVEIAVVGLGSIATCAAVIVALAKERIMRFFAHPSISVMMHDPEGFEEHVDTEQINPSSEMYYCLLDIINKGNATANNCEIRIDKILFAESRDKQLKTIDDGNIANSGKVPWEGEERVTLFQSIPIKVLLFKIIPPNNSGTPDNNGDNKEKAKFLLSGYELKDKYSHKGYWEISYYIAYDSGDHHRFKITIEWDGEWKTRQKEMKEVLQVKLI